MRLWKSLLVVLFVLGFSWDAYAMRIENKPLDVRVAHEVLAAAFLWLIYSATAQLKRYK